MVEPDMVSANKQSFSFAAATLLFSVLLFVALLPIIPRGAGVQTGAIATRTIRAPRNISFVSQSLTQQRQNEAAAAVLDSLTLDPTIATTQEADLNTILSQIQSALATSDPKARTQALGQIQGLNLSQASATYLSNLQASDFGPISDQAKAALGKIYDQSLPSDSVQDIRQQADTYIDASFSRQDTTLIADILRPLIISNQVLDTDRTNQAREAARENVAPVQVSFAKDQIIVEKDSPITAEAREALIQAGLVGDTWSPELIGASLMLAIVAAITIVAGIRAFRPRSDAHQLLLIGLVIAIPVFILKVYLPLILPDDQRHFLAYILPVSVSSMVLAGFIGAEVALLGAAMIAFLTAFVAVLLLDVTVVGIAGSLEIARLALVSGIASAAGVFAVRNAERLAHFLLGGLLVGITIFVILCATWLLEPGHELRDIAWILLAAGANGGLSAFISAGAFVTLGTVFGVTTRVQLLEMSQLSQPLLLRLQDEAPSTFQHSVIMANMAEKGAHVIGADALITRVGCYYHDIGKLARPGFFIENQMGGTNPHDALQPNDSARIIADHVTDGINLGRQHKLPPRILSFIPEHHGTRMVSYFYRKAYEEDPTVNPDDFRYPGPKPQSRETAIAMLADSSEAAVRSNPDHSPEAIDELVDTVFAERLSEGQLDESDLTLRDIRSLAQSFKDTLKAMYHPRIEYPAPSEAELLLRKLPFRRYSENN